MSAVVHARDMNIVRGAATILDDITVDIYAGQVVGVIGRNGAGKSTLLSAIAGLVRRRTNAISLNWPRRFTRSVRYIHAHE